LLNQVVGFGAACLALIAIPGPSVLFIIGRTLALGRRASIVTIFGNALGAYTLGIVVSLGAGPLLQRFPSSLIVVQLAGAAFLCWLGIDTIRSRETSHELDDATGSGRLVGRGNYRALRQGYIVGVTNPKVLVVFAVIMPTFLVQSVQPLAVQMILLALVPVIIGLLSDSAWSVFSGAGRRWFADNDKRMSMLSVIGGCLMICLAGFLALEVL